MYVDAILLYFEDEHKEHYMQMKTAREQCNVDTLTNVLLYNPPTLSIHAIIDTLQILFIFLF